MRFLIPLTIILMFGCVSLAFSQSIEWRTQSPCDGAFNVSVPVPLYKVGSFEGAHGALLNADMPFDSGVAAYAAIQSKPHERQFGVVEFDVPKNQRKDLAVGDLSGWNYMIGGDDASPTSDKSIRVNGLVGKEYVYAKAIRLETYTRGRIFYVKGRLYFVILITSSADELTSPDADRFLNSFRLRKR